MIVLWAEVRDFCWTFPVLQHVAVFMLNKCMYLN